MWIVPVIVNKYFGAVRNRLAAHKIYGGMEDACGEGYLVLIKASASYRVGSVPFIPYTITCIIRKFDEQVRTKKDSVWRNADELYDRESHIDKLPGREEALPGARLEKGGGTRKMDVASRRSGEGIGERTLLAGNDSGRNRRGSRHEQGQSWNHAEEG